MKSTGERIIVHKGSENDLCYLRHMSAYTFAESFTKDKIVLDSGSGSGYGSYHLITHEAKNVIGIDIAQNAIEYAKRKYNFKNLEFKTMNSTELIFDDETFDVVTSFQVIEHIKDTNEFLLESKRVLKKGGFFLVSTPNKKTYSPNTVKPQNPFHVKEFYLDEFDKLLRIHFNKVKIIGVSKSPKLKKFEDSFSHSFRRHLGKLLINLRLSIFLRIVPRQLKGFLFGHYRKNIDISDFKITKFDIEGALDFIGVCKKI